MQQHVEPQTRKADAKKQNFAINCNTYHRSELITHRQSTIHIVSQPTARYVTLAFDGRRRRRCETSPSKKRLLFFPDPSPGWSGTSGCPSSRSPPVVAARFGAIGQCISGQSSIAQANQGKLRVAIRPLRALLSNQSVFFSGQSEHCYRANQRNVETLSGQLGHFS